MMYSTKCDMYLKCKKSICKKILFENCGKTFFDFHTKISTIKSVNYGHAPHHHQKLCKETEIKLQFSKHIFDENTL